MALLSFPHIMYGLPHDIIKGPVKERNPTGIAAIPPENNQSDFFTAAEQAQPSAGKSELQLFSSEYIEDIEALLQEYIARQLYMQPDCSLIQLSNHVEIPAHHLTYYFNTICKLSFSDWRNQLRIEFAVGILNQGTSSQITLEGIGVQVGFKSYSTFVRSFKKVTGKTPSDHLLSIC
jgi:AraC-like DNA-binding protein